MIDKITIEQAGDYALIPVDELAALRADSDRLSEIYTERMNNTTTTSPMVRGVSAPCDVEPPRDTHDEVARLRSLLYVVRGMLWDDEPEQALKAVVAEVGRAALAGKEDK